MIGTLVSARQLHEHIGEPDWVLFDVRHDLMNPSMGLTMYQSGHIPGAVHAHIDADLSSPVGDGMAGRHPLPDKDHFQSFLRRHGVDDDSLVISYDDQSGMWAARLWWLMRYFGHENTAVLDGGIGAWTDAGYDISENPDPPLEPGNVTLDAGHMPTITLDDIEAGRAKTLIDARAPERFRGDSEPIDAAAGHIPGAINMPFSDNLDSDGRFLDKATLHRRFDKPRPVATYCGSGVTAAHNVLAAVHAGLPAPALSPESWSGWSTQGRAVATGAA